VFSANEILDMAIRIEKNGEAVYREAIEKISGAQLGSVLEWMADEEVKHANCFASLKEKIESTPTNLFVEEMSRELFNDLLGEKSFSHKEVNFSQIEDVNDLIAIFIEFEEDTILFYEMLVPFVEDESALENLKKIIAEENNHIDLLRQFSENKEGISLDSS
jgi:rubrerythrin